MKIIIICGQTATGKSSLAIELAKRLHKLGQPVEVISADSRQIYKGLDMSSNKVTIEEMNGVAHHMISITPCGTRYTVADYQTQTRALIIELIEKGITPIICGGTGLYIDAVMYDNFMFGEGVKGSIDYTSKLWKSRENVSIVWIGLTAPRDHLINKINTRALQNLNCIKKEITNLITSGTNREWLFGLGLEPKLMIQVLENNMTEHEYTNELTTKSWQYARRQMTWFRRNPNITWFDISTTSQENIIDSLLN